MVKAHRPWPCPQHVAWPSPYLNCSCTSPELSLRGHSAYPNPSTSFFPAISAFPGFTVHAALNLKTEQTNEVNGFLQYPHSEPSLKETHAGGVMQFQNANPVPLQKKLLIFDHSGNKTRLFYSPVLQLVQSPIVTAAQFGQVYDVNKEEKATNMGQKHIPKYSLTEESDKQHLVNEESEMHEDTEEINALLYSDDSDFDGDDDDDEVKSTGHSPLVTKRTYVMQEKLDDSKEGVASSDSPNKRLKLTNGGYDRSPLLEGSAGLSRLNEACEYASDAESKYSSCPVYPDEQTKDNNSAVDDIQFEKDKIRESLRVLENLVPGAKGKHPLLVIDGTIEYLKSLMTQICSPGVSNATKGSLLL